MIPRLVLMQDKNPYSPTYGSFDRSYPLDDAVPVLLEVPRDLMGGPVRPRRRADDGDGVDVAEQLSELAVLGAQVQVGQLLGQVVVQGFW